jgi:hypothetical protein
VYKRKHKETKSKKKKKKKGTTSATYKAQVDQIFFIKLESEEDNMHAMMLTCMKEKKKMQHAKRDQ